MTTRTRPFSTPRKSSSAHKTPPKKIKAFAAAKKTETKPKAPDRSAKTGLLRKKNIIVTTKRKKQLSYRRNKTTVHRTSFYLPHDLITAFYFFKNSPKSCYTQPTAFLRVITEPSESSVRVRVSFSMLYEYVLVLLTVRISVSMLSLPASSIL